MTNVIDIFLMLWTCPPTLSPYSIITINRWQFTSRICLQNSTTAISGKFVFNISDDIRRWYFSINTRLLLKYHTWICVTLWRNDMTFNTRLIIYRPYVCRNSISKLFKCRYIHTERQTNTFTLPHYIPILTAERSLWSFFTLLTVFLVQSRKCQKKSSSTDTC